MTNLRRVITVLAFLGVAALGSAQSVPSYMNYQGMLTDATGKALATANYTLTFKIYSAPSGGILKWGPQIFDGVAGTGHGAQVPVVNGYFNVILGPVDTASRDILRAFHLAPCFLEVTVGTGSPIAPRTQVLTAPFAAKARTAGEVGDLKLSARTADHSGWLVCDGRAVSRSTYSALFAIVSTSYGVGDGTATFNLPDARGRVVGGVGQGPGLTNRTLGAVIGEESHTQSIAEMPSHRHKQQDHPDRGGNGGITVYSTSDPNFPGDMWTSSSGGGQPFNVMQPTIFAGTCFIYSGFE